MGLARSRKDLWPGMATRPDVPAAQSYKDADEYLTAFASEIKPAIEGKRDIVAFDQACSYRGTGHGDLFQCERALDAGDSVCESQRVLLWYI
jgi:hypothetical protein